LTTVDMLAIHTSKSCLNSDPDMGSIGKIEANQTMFNRNSRPIVTWKNLWNIYTVYTHTHESKKM